MGVAFVYNGRHIRTPALSGSILPSITRDSILRLAPELGLPVHEDRLAIDRVLHDIASGEITEAFCLGTAAVIAPIGRHGFRGKDYFIRGTEASPVAKRLYQALTDIQYGRAQDTYGWTIPVEADALGGEAHTATAA